MYRDGVRPCLNISETLGSIVVKFLNRHWGEEGRIRFKARSD